MCILDAWSNGTVAFIIGTFKFSEAPNYNLPLKHLATFNVNLFLLIQILRNRSKYFAVNTTTINYLFIIKISVFSSF